MFLTLLLLSGVVCALSVITSHPWHPAQHITNSGGRVFDDEGRAYLCDAVSGLPTMEILRPNAPGDETSATHQSPWGSGEHWDKVDEPIPDGDGTYVCTVAPHNTELWSRDLYGLPDCERTDIITKVVIYATMRKTGIPIGYGDFKFSLKTHGTVYDSDAVPLTESWAEYSKEYTTNPSTGAAWTWGEINALQIGINYHTRFYPNDFGRAECTQLYAAVDYSVIEYPEVNLIYPNHPLQQIAKSSTDLESIDSDNNGWPDAGVGLTGSSSPDQSPAGDVYHPISQIRRGISGAQNRKIDSDGNGWPDMCDSILEKPYAECVARCANDNDAQCEAGETRIYLYGSGTGCATADFSGEVEGVTINCGVLMFWGVDMMGEWTSGMEWCNESVGNSRSDIYCSSAGTMGTSRYDDKYDSSCAICCK